MKNLKMLFVMLICVGLTSCGDELGLNELSDSEIVDVENFVDEAISGIQDRVAAGRNGCVEFVFPISVAFVDGTTATADDYESLHAVIKSWKENNLEEGESRRANRPELVLPVQVVNEDGEIIDVATEEELKAIFQECGGKFGKWKKGKRGHRGKGYSCFSLVFPVTVDFANGTSVTFEDRQGLKAGIRAYKESNGRGQRPTLAYPITVEYDDGTQTAVDSKEALKELKQACADEE